MTRVAPILVLVAVAALAGCSSKDKQTPNGQPPSTSGSVGGGTGPLAQLEASPFINEVWTSQDGQQLPMIIYTRENVRMSAGCRNPAGQLNCDAIRQIRGGQAVDIPKRSLTGNVSAGTRVCTKMGNTLVPAHNSVGNEDGFCRFPDGSLLATGTLEQYGMHVIE